MVEPIDPLQGGEFEVVESPPRSFVTDKLGLVETDDRLGQGVVITGSRRGTQPKPPPRSRRDVRCNGSTDTAQAQPVVATPPCSAERRSWSRASAGVRQPRVLRGRVLSVWATASISSAPHRDRSVPLGKYESPRVWWRLRSLRRMELCQDMGDTPPRCVSGRCGWCLIMSTSTDHSGKRSARSPRSSARQRRRCGCGYGRRNGIPAAVRV